MEFFGELGSNRISNRSLASIGLGLIAARGDENDLEHKKMMPERTPLFDLCHANNASTMVSLINEPSLTGGSVGSVCSSMLSSQVNASLAYNKHGPRRMESLEQSLTSRHVADCIPAFDGWENQMNHS
eukprot:scaffold162688_cov71-Attheya_sp.AAC.1